MSKIKRSTSNQWKSYNIITNQWFYGRIPSFFLLTVALFVVFAFLFAVCVLLLDFLYSVVVLAGVLIGFFTKINVSLIIPLLGVGLVVMGELMGSLPHVAVFTNLLVQLIISTLWVKDAVCQHINESSKRVRWTIVCKVMSVIAYFAGATVFFVYEGRCGYGG